MSTTSWKPLLDEATSWIKEAGDLTLKLFQTERIEIEDKSDGSPVTQADRGAERLLRERIEARFPDDGILGEEEGEKPSKSGRRWIIDPIDGTKAFTRGVPLYSNLLALEDDEGSAIGIIHVPALGETVAAARGAGCHYNGKPTRVGTRSELRGAYLMTSGVEHTTIELLTAARDAGMIVRTWGDAYGYLLVATARVDAMVDMGVHAYDLAPMPVILAEAGGRFTDLEGQARIDGGTGLGSNGVLHEALLECLGARGG